MIGQDVDSTIADGELWVRTRKARNFTHWSLKQDRFYATNVTHNALPPGVYESEEDENSNAYLREIEFPSDELISMAGTPISYVLGQIDNFQKKLPLFTRLKLVYKRGILFYGPAGCGKTSMIRLIANEVIKGGGIVVSISNLSNDQTALLKLRQIEPERQVLAIFEDIEKLMGTDEHASDLLSFLDGEKQIGNIISIATTNKPDILEDRLLKRPGRFDVIIGLNPPIAEARRQYLERLFQDFEHGLDMDKVVADTEGLGLAHLREVAVSVVCLDQPYEETIKRLKGNIKEQIKVPKVGQKCTTGFTLGFTQEKSDDKQIG